MRKDQKSESGDTAPAGCRRNWQLYGFGRADFGTDKIRAFLDGCGRPQDRLRVIHIAGSKGKGSTAALFAALLSGSGTLRMNPSRDDKNDKVGVFSSPYLFDEREMITINGEMIAQEDFDRLRGGNAVAAANLSEFEVMTAVAFRYFHEQKVDYAVIECGLGGLRDATNVCAKPVLTVLTRIEKEHVDYFSNRLARHAASGFRGRDDVCGSSRLSAGLARRIAGLADIVHEKCGILRRGVPLICFDSGRYVNARIRECAKLAGAHLLGFWKTNEEVAVAAFGNVVTSTPGSTCEPEEVTCAAFFNRPRLTLARPRCEIGALAMLASSSHAGRFQIEDRNGVTFVFDVAHTPASAAYLRARLDERFPGKSIVFLLAFLKDKNVKKIVQALVKPRDGAIFTEVDHPRALRVHQLPVTCAPMKNREYALAKAVRDARKKSGIVCVTGSFETVKFVLGNLSR